ncbi:NAD(P)/FAD-dependent oxidoreductase [Methylorubrum sp. SB2]|uniref:NAD(P)/FAD-dependent oxidoreductase n=1 Tax=Methylorubrum subtropicum TaxID=3138812 RepID=UPI00313CFC1E
MRIAIVGAGMAGLACGRALTEAGHDVALFDKGRRPGGRMASRQTDTPLGPAGFDHGAQYLTARDPGFRAELEAWRAKKIVAPWPAAGPEAWVGVPDMSAPLRAMADGLPIRWSHRIEILARETEGWRLRGQEFDAGGFDAVLTALPAEQTAALLHEAAPEIAATAAATPSEPCWTAMAAFSERLDGIPDTLRSEGDVAWAARDSAKPGRGGPEAFVIQASAAWSRENLERSAEDVARDLLTRFFEAGGATPVAPAHLAAHRWRYAASGKAGRDRLWDPARGIGACGDWLIGPRIENAWLSGHRLAAALGR